VFDYGWIEEDPKTALREPNSIVLTKSIANKYFGNQEALGRVINLENRYSLKVTGVIKDLP
jgi:putative ABC transport system permease protein